MKKLIGVFHTIFPSIVKKSTRLIATNKYELELQNGDKCILLENLVENSTPKKNILIIHGLGSSPYDVNINRITQKLISKNYRVYRLCLKGVSEARGLSKSIYNAMTTEEVLESIEFIEKNNLSSELTLMAYSLGSNILMKSLSQFNDKKFKRIILLSPVFYLKESVDAISFKYFGVFNKLIVSELKKYLLSKKQKFKFDFEFDKTKLNTLADLDEKVVVPSLKLINRDEYYQLATAIDDLYKNQNKIDILIAKDDPIAVLEYEKLNSTEKFNVKKIKSGGHLGFYKISINKNVMDDFIMEKLSE